MFQKNKYTKWYMNIINNAKNRSLPSIMYTEKHHIIPECFYIRRKRKGPKGFLRGDSDDKNNLIVLTAKEHFICHLLLTKMVERKYQFKINKAFIMLAFIKDSNQKRFRINGKIYDLIKNLKIEMTEETKSKISISQRKRFKNRSGTFLGKKHSVKTRKKMSIAASKPKSQKWKESASTNRKGRQSPNKGIPMSEKTKQKIRESTKGERNHFYGKHHTLEQRERKRQEKLNQPRKLCMHCNQSITIMTYGRYHGEKCKYKK